MTARTDGSVSAALKRLGAKRMGWWLNKEWFIAEGGEMRKLNMRNPEDRVAIRDAIRYFESRVPMPKRGGRNGKVIGRKRWRHVP